MTPLEQIEAALAEIEQDAVHEKDDSAIGHAPCVTTRLRLIAALRKAVQGLEVYERNAWLAAVAKALTGEGEGK